MTLGRPATLMMSGAWPPPAPSVWKAWMVRPLKAAMRVLDEARLRSACRCGSSPARRSRRRPTGSSRWRPASCPSPRAASGRRRRRATCSSSACGQRGIALAGEGRGSSGRRRPPAIMRAMCQGPGVQVVASVPCAGPVPPPSMVVTPDISASSICCGQMKWMWLSMPPAVRILPSPAMTSVPGPMMMVDARLGVGVAGLADGGDAAVLQADIGLVDAGSGRRSARW